MRPLEELPPAARRKIRFVLTDMDDTLTFRGRLSGATYGAMEKLREAGFVLVPVTAAPAGWCDLIARMWPVDAVIGENGGLYFRREADGQAIQREFWLPADERARAMARLAETARGILLAAAEARPASDQPFRETTWAIEPLGRGDRRAATAEEVARVWRAAGMRSTINSLWVLGWVGDFDKLAMSLRMASELYAADLSSERDAVIYVGDSLNDEPMFEYFPNSVGVSMVAQYLDRMRAPPRWTTRGPGGAGFVEVADALLAAR
ncbi:MAG TPA: HAD-IIB family hydrolase [Stellaceae bacterium]|nr:HAD-IIB family hydrolase [Stellaceae bacterium]